jgi:RNA-directed DNA polymerase
MSKTDLNNTVEWNELNWRKIQKAIFKLQKRIYRAYVNGDVRKGRRLQKTLIKSYYNRLLSVRKVTQDNQGKKTAGVDRVKSLNPKQRLELAKNLKLGSKAKPVLRVWIPKPGKADERAEYGGFPHERLVQEDEKRPLGIPVMRDRAAQALAKSALEPEWEAKFEPNSYGFRPGRGAHDAIEAIFKQIKCKSKFVLDADISKCFDKPLFHYHYRCTLVRQGEMVGQGDGSCNLLENKYEKQKYKIYDLTNTIVKMAQKRALVAAVLSSCGASEFFSQDLETMAGGKS